MKSNKYFDEGSNIEIILNKSLVKVMKREMIEAKVNDDDAHEGDFPACRVTTFPFI